MGCAGSKQKRCQHCRAPYAPVRRSYSMHVEHRLEQAKSESFHLVALTSSTLGSLKLDLSTSLADPAHLDVDFVSNKDGGGDRKKPNDGKSEKEQFLEGIVEARTWSSMIEGKIPKTPIRPPVGEPETIDALELMKGLEDISPFRSPSHLRSFSSDVIVRKSLETLPEDRESPPESAKKEKVVVYFTSLRGVRKTYEDCCDVRVILKGTGARVDERDVSMHSGFKEELKELMGEEYSGVLPKVFVDRKCIGGAEEVRRLHEEGRLAEELKGCEMVGDEATKECEACGDVRFVPCESCSGSCKIYYDDDEEENEEDGNRTVRHEEEESDQFGFRRCPDCNENGLVRCPLCCF